MAAERMKDLLNARRELEAAQSATPASEGDKLLALFGAWAMDTHRDDVGDLDGGSIQDQLEKLGMLESVNVTEPCGEFCKCAEYDDFPQDCLRATPAVREALSKARKVLLAPSDNCKAQEGKDG
jgi:hypothetical protein